MSEGLASPCTLTALLDAGRDDAVALLSAGEAVTYAELRRDVGRLADGLRAHGLAPGERVLVAFPNGPGFVVATLAVWRCGAVVVPIDARSPASQALRIAKDCGVTTLLADGAVHARLEPQLGELPSLERSVVARPRPASHPRASLVVDYDALLAEPAPRAALPDDDPRRLALLAYTSGSTGRPKGVMHDHRGLLSSLVFTRDHLGLGPDDRVLVAFPLYHLFSFRVTLAHLLAGATVIVERDLFAGLRRAEQTRPTALALVPAACRLLLDRFAPVLARIADGVRRVSIGSAAISPARLRALRTLLPRATVHIPYGMTEARIGFLEPDGSSSERRLLAHDPGLQLEVLDEDGQPVHEGVGELVLRGPALTRGYWHQREDASERLQREGLRTRDLMRVDPDGRLCLVGRLDDVVSVGGEKVFPLEVEFALRSHPAVHDARVTGVPDPRGVRGQLVRAEVVLAPEHDLDPDELLAHCRRQLEPYKVPAQLEAVPEIHRNAMGKVVALPHSP